ncbi:Endophilin-A2 [Trichinella nelsoni]|uniref:Endophilin-A2 n=1 Tax=Trichinella nelsoni TaxID=6336 RepID=A0A0V0SF57_9BILA|nr:Endophilin-A2 [Trichinella nelsoni]
MSLAGLRKQINKANQYVSERVGAAEATKLDETYLDMEKKIEITSELIDDLTAKTREFLQPNPATRAKMATVSTISKLRGTSKAMPYPQPEGVLGDSMLRYGRLLGERSYFGRALIDAGESFKMMADVKYALEDNVRQNFLDPLSHLQATDLKEVNHHRKKLHGRRLDYDCKKRKQIKGNMISLILQNYHNLYDEELKLAEEKLEESKRLAEIAMFNVLDNDVEQVSQLFAFVEAQLDFHRQTTQILENLSYKLKEEVQEASSRPRQNHNPQRIFFGHSTEAASSKPIVELDNWNKSSSSSAGAGASGAGVDIGSGNLLANTQWSVSNQQQDPWNTPLSAENALLTNTQPALVSQKPCCKALYDFEPENPGELGFHEGQIITLTSQIDENWFQGTLPDGTCGFFPISYVEVLIPLPR